MEMQGVFFEVVTEFLNALFLREFLRWFPSSKLPLCVSDASLLT
jgi:hypothetical protein